MQNQIASLKAPSPIIEKRPSELSFEELLGLQLQESDEGLQVVHVSPFGPANACGLHVGDRVLEINGVPVRKVSVVQQVIGRVPSWSTVKITRIRHGSAARDVLEVMAKFA
jgi:C-terminal processing protease CtpA/Prc